MANDSVTTMKGIGRLFTKALEIAATIVVGGVNAFFYFIAAPLLIASQKPELGGVNLRSIVFAFLVPAGMIAMFFLSAMLLRLLNRWEEKRSGRPSEIADLSPRTYRVWRAIFWAYIPVTMTIGLAIREAFSHAEALGP